MNILKHINTICITLGLITLIVCITIVLHNLNKDDSNQAKQNGNTKNNTKTELQDNINELDSIKNEEIKHSKNLNNDSSIILFYELIREK